MQKIRNFIQENKPIMIAIASVFVIAIILLGIVYILLPKKEPDTGGAGTPPNGTVIIHGWDTENQFNIAIGDSLTIDDENTITKSIQSDLEKKKIVERSFRATITDVTGEYSKPNNIDKNTITIKIDSHPDIIYTVTVDYPQDQPIVKIVDNKNNNVDINVQTSASLNDQ